MATSINECTADLSETKETQDEVKPLSKNQQKKMRKLEMKSKFRVEKRKLERERKKEKRKQAIAEGQILPPSRKKIKKTGNEPVNINVAIDSSFEEHMVENDIKKLVKQIQHCYALNRRAEQPFKYYVTSYEGQVKHIIDNLAGTSNWNINWSEKAYTDVFEKDQIVYLTAESENALTKLEEGKVYVIGGLVDHNSKKGLCHRLAVERGVAHAHLPISEYIDLKCRKVLTIDHVFAILQTYQKLGDWEKAFFSVIPKRKGAQSKEGPKNGDNSDDSDVCDKGDEEIHINDDNDEECALGGDTGVDDESNDKGETTMKKLEHPSKIADDDKALLSETKFDSPNTRL